jgi:predicted amidohydrolase YtcJ
MGLPNLIRAFVAGAIIATAAPLSSQAPPAPAAPVTVIRAGTLLDGVSPAVRRDQAIVVRGHRIESVAQEFPRLVEFGLTPMEAIQSATSRAAEMLGKKGELGVVAPGAYADVIAVAGDPLADVHVLENVSFVMKDGRIYRGAPR